MNRERLQHLITILERVPPSHLEMEGWICGTSACAIGWAARDPVFNQQGFMLRNTRSPFPVYVLDGAPVADNPDSWDAVMAFFELTLDDALYMFSHRMYTSDEKDDEGFSKTFKPTPADVIARIRELLAREEA
jgi:hypothetical protein